ncbi:hypothetical protein ACQUFY_12015 [Robbsia andropogonis]|uniref:hypothetical protein n=1 Tax=Robbsia andropogonis TaxID=28092 RepID=UPI003D1A9711
MIIDQIIFFLRQSAKPMSQLEISQHIERDTAAVYGAIRAHRVKSASPRLYIAEYGRTSRGQRSPHYAIGDLPDAPAPMLRKEEIRMPAGQFGIPDEAKARAAKIAAQDKLIASLLSSLRTHAGNPFGVAMAQFGVRA